MTAWGGCAALRLARSVAKRRTFVVPGGGLRSACGGFRAETIGTERGLFVCLCVHARRCNASATRCRHGCAVSGGPTGVAYSVGQWRVWANGGCGPMAGVGQRRVWANGGCQRARLTCSTRSSSPSVRKRIIWLHLCPTCNEQCRTLSVVAMLRRSLARILRMRQAADVCVVSVVRLA
jgi:hypothetical protein